MFTPPTFEEHSMGGLRQEDNDIVAVRYDQPPIDEATLRSPAISANVFQNQVETEGILTRPEEVSNVEYGMPEMNATVLSQLAALRWNMNRMSPLTPSQRYIWRQS